MKPRANPFLRSAVFASVFTVFGIVPQQARAADGIWGADTDGAWATAGSWSGGTAPGATSGSNSDTATFDGAGDYVVSLGGGSTPRHIGTINITNTGTTTFNNGGYLYLYDALTMAATAGAVDLGGNFRFNGTTNTVTNNSSELLTISAATSRTVSGGGTVTITGSGDTTITGAITQNGSFGNLSFVKEGSGVLTLSGNNTYTGTTSITAGKLIAGHNAALGSTAAGTSVSGTGILDINGKSLGTEVITISGTGDGNGALVNNGADQINAIGRLVLAADASIGGTNRWDLRNSTPTLNMGGFTLTKTGAGYVGLVGVAVSNPGNIDVTDGTFSLQTSTNMGGSSANTITVRNGAILSSYQAANQVNWSLDLKNGATLRSESAGAATQNTWAGPVTLENSGTVTIDAAATMTISGGISGTGSAINKTGGGTLTLSGANSYSGTTTVSAGTLVLANTSVLAANNVVSASGTSGVEFATDTALSNTIRLFTSSGSTVTYTLNRATSGAAVSQSTGAAAMGNGNVNVLAGGNVSSGTPTLGFSGITLSGGAPGTVTLNPTTGNISAGTVTAVATHAKTLVLGGTSTGNEITGAISDGSSGAAVSVTKSNNGTWTLTGDNSYTGVTTISGGVLNIRHNNALGTTAANTSIGSGAKLQIEGSGLLIAENFSVGGGTIENVSGNNTLSGTITKTSTLTLLSTAGKLTVQGGIDGTGNSVFLQGAGDGEVSGDISTAFAVNKSDTGTWTLSGNNSYDTVTALSGGILNIRSNNALGTTAGNTTIALGTKLQIEGSGLSIAENFSVAGGTIENVSGNNTLTGTITKNSNAVFLLSTAGNLTVQGDIDGSSNTVALQGAGNGEVSGNISTALALTKSGAGTWTLSGANTFKATTNIEGGTLALANDLALQNSTLNTDFANGGTLDTAGVTSPTIGALTGAGDLTLHASVTGLTLNNTSGNSQTYSGDLTAGNANMTLTKIGSNSQVLTGNNSYSGLTTVTGSSILYVGSAGAIGTGAVQVDSGSRLGLVNGITLGSGRTITISGDGSAGSSQQLFGALSSYSAGVNEWAGNVTIGAVGTRIGAYDGTLKVSGVISGSNTGLFIRGDSGAVVELSGANDYTGDTTIAANSTFLVKLSGGANRLPTGTNLIMGAFSVGSKLDLNGQDQEVAGISVGQTSGTPSNEITSSTGSSVLTVNTSAASSYSGTITGSIALTKQGADTLTLSGTNTYTGDTTVSAGTLVVNGSISTSVTTVETGGTLAGTGTVGAVVVEAGGTLSPGNSPGTLTVDGGSLQLGADGNLNWQVYDASGVAGTGYDTVNLTNAATLDLSLLSAVNQYNINLWSLSGIAPDANGDATNFDNTLSYSWTLFSTGSAISGFDASYFNILVGSNNGTSGFTNDLGGGTFSLGLADSDTDLVLNFTPVPEPRAALLGGLGLLMLLRRRRD